MSNPFATSFTAPGCVEFIFADSMNVDRLLEQFTQQGSGQIVGPHGSGKSTLLHQLTDRLASTHALQRIDVRKFRKLPGLTPFHAVPGKLIFVIDGFEQLLPTAQQSFLQWTSQHDFGLLVTSHVQVAGLPLLFQTRPTLEVFRQLTELLLQRQGQSHRIKELPIESSFNERRGDIREALFQLYDQFETCKISQHDPQQA